MASPARAAGRTMQRAPARCWTNAPASSARSLELERLRGVDVADGDGESVGGVGRFGRAVEREQAGDHELDLLLGGEAVASDGGLDGERRILGDGEIAGGGGQHGHSSDLTEFERGLGVGGEEDLLDGDAVGGVEGHQRGEFRVDLGEALRGFFFLVWSYGACGGVRLVGIYSGALSVSC